MRSFWRRIHTFMQGIVVRAEDRVGQAMIEYALILSLVVVVILVTLIVLGNTVKNTYCNIEAAVVGA